MSSRSLALGSLVVLVALVSGVFLLLAGCQKDKPVTQQPAQSGQKMAMHDPAAMDQTPVKAVAGEQTTCPVMGGAIDKTIFVEYKGKKVYFCCPGCVETFKANPEKYLAKLPQFAQ